jgi:hypothetical protein
MSTLIEKAVVDTEVTADVDASFAHLVARLVALAGGELEWALLEPAALVLAREDGLTSPGLTFGCDYDLSIRSHELRRGFVRAMTDGLVDADGHRMWLLPRGVELTIGDDAETAAGIFALEPHELARRARHLLLSD